jgi:hypothetical protein
MFAQLAALRGEINAIPIFSIDPPQRTRLIAALRDLDDAMVKWVRAEHFAKTQHEAAPSFDIADFANNQFALIASIQMAVSA